MAIDIRILPQYKYLDSSLGAAKNLPVLAGKGYIILNNKYRIKVFTFNCSYSIHPGSSLFLLLQESALHT